MEKDACLGEKTSGSEPVFLYFPSASGGYSICTVSTSITTASIWVLQDKEMIDYGKDRVYLEYPAFKI